MRRFLRATLRVAFLILSLGLTEGVRADHEGSPGPGMVMTWVPPYAIAASKARLEESFDGVGMKDGITHLGLQFWNPTRDGKIEMVSRFGGVNESRVSELREWGKTHEVCVMLCVYNATPDGWDWELARSAFEKNQEDFIEAIVSETLRLELDGVDIDLEGKGNQEASKEAFVRFIRKLSKRLRAEGKQLTVDSFAYKWHAPRQSWWPELLPHVDGLNVMGYSETGAASDDWRAYESLKAAAGDYNSKLLIGMPGHLSEWQKAVLGEHLGWVVDDQSVGLAIWDARLQNPNWRAKETWQAIAAIRNRKKKENTTP